MNEGEREIVERERLCARVVELTHDRQRGAMLLGGPFVLAFAPKLSSELVESTRPAARVGCSWFPRTHLEGGPGLLRGPVREAPEALRGVELVDGRPQLSRGALDRRP
jgi:hypothetical protein